VESCSIKQTSGLVTHREEFLPVYLTHRDYIFGNQRGIERQIFNLSRNEKAELFISITTVG